ncbi:hypothetical protein BDP27DRAFT_1429438 [Rhodocollybia butyracea]|uniref:Uncharacterized protein n=1 Tax=Rhodocollybia butyracea TaxID=206335 RepID=A0A9P5P8N1_9AGAR|nr:hypothetical protein BDP27DRAFT_1429438 [Rhodocollybia butyracea]
MSESSEREELSNTSPSGRRGLGESREGSPSSMRSVIETGPQGSSTPPGINSGIRQFPARVPSPMDGTRPIGPGLRELYGLYGLLRP